MDSATGSYVSSNSTDIPPHALQWNPRIRRAKSSDILVQYDLDIPLKDIYILPNDPSPVVAKRCDFCTHRKKRCTREVLGCARCKEYGETCRFSRTGWDHLGKNNFRSPVRKKSQPNRDGSARKEPRQSRAIVDSVTGSRRVADRSARQSLPRKAIQDVRLDSCGSTLKKRKLRSSGPVDSDTSSLSIPLAQARRSNEAEAGPSKLSIPKTKAKRPRKAPRPDPPTWQVPKISIQSALQTRIRKAIETHPRIWTGSRAELSSVIPSLAKPGSDIIFEDVDTPTIIFPGHDDSDSALGKWDDDNWNGRELIFSVSVFHLFWLANSFANTCIDANPTLSLVWTVQRLWDFSRSLLHPASEYLTILIPRRYPYSVREARITCPKVEDAVSNADDGSCAIATATSNRPDEHASDAMSIDRLSSPEVSLSDTFSHCPVDFRGESVGFSSMDGLKHLNFAYDQPMPDFLSPEGNEAVPHFPAADAMQQSATLPCSKETLESVVRAFLDDTSLLSAVASIIGDTSTTTLMHSISHPTDDSTMLMHANGLISDLSPSVDLSTSSSALSHSMTTSPSPAAPSLAGLSEGHDQGVLSVLPSDESSSAPMDVLPSGLDPHDSRSPSRATSLVSSASTIDSALPPYPPEVARLIGCLSQGELVSVILSQESPLVPWQLPEEIGYMWAGLFRLTSIKESTHLSSSTADPSSSGCSSSQSIVRRCWKVHMQWVPGGEALLHDDMDEGYLRWLESTSLPWWETASQGASKGSMMDVCADPFVSSLLPLDLIAPFSATSSSGDSFPLGWYCSKCGRVNVQRYLRHRICESRVCAGETGDVLEHRRQEGWAADITSVRDPCRIAVCVAPDDFHVDDLVTRHRFDSTDGRSVYQYHIPSIRDVSPGERPMGPPMAKHDRVSHVGDMDVWHLFTSNLPHAQAEPTKLFAKIQREVLLERGPGTTMFSASSSLPDESTLEPQDVDDVSCFLQAARFMERAAQQSLRFETSLKTQKLEMQACLAESKSRGTFHCKAIYTTLLCLGADVVLSIVRKDLKKPTPVLTKSKKRDPHEVLSVTLLHGDMAVLHGDDIEYFMLSTGMSIVVIGECLA